MPSPSPEQINLNDDQVLNLLNTIPSMTLVLDEQYQVIFTNQSFCNFFEKNPGDLPETNLLELLPGNTGDTFKKHLDDLSPNNPKQSQIITVPIPEGKFQYQEWTFKLKAADSGAKKQYYVFGRDLNETIHEENGTQKLNDRKLNEEIFQKITNSIQEAFWVMDSNWSEVLYANSTCEKIYGVPYKKLLDDVENWTKHIQPDDLDRMYSDLAPEIIEDLNEPKNVKFRIDHPDRGPRHINLEISPIPEDGPTQRLVGLASDITEKENKLQRRKQKFEAIFNSTVSSLGLLNPDGTIVEANKTALRLIEESMQEIRGQKFWKSPWWSHTGTLQKRLKEAVTEAANGEISEFEATYPFPSGGEASSLFSIVPIKNNQDEVEYLVAEGRDISDHKELEDKLEEQRDFLESIINAAQQGIFVKRYNGEYVLANDTVSDIFGLPRDEIEGSTDHQLLDDEIAEKFRRDDKQVLEIGESIQYEDKVPDTVHGETRTFLTVKTPMFTERPPEDRLVIGITTDITKRKLLQKELQEQKDYLQKIIDSVPTFIFVKDWNGVYQIANDALADFYDTDPEKIIGQTDADFNPNPEEIESFLEDDREVMRSGESKEIAEKAVTDPRTGETYWFQTIKVPLFLDQPVKKRQVLGISTNITKMKKIRENLEKSLQEKETLLGEIHHRVKNNLQIIQSMLQIEQREADEKNPALEDCINRINSMALLHEKLYRSDQLSKIDISSYFDELCRHLKRASVTEAKNIEIVLSTDFASIPIQEAVSCGLVVNELVTNALQHGFKDAEKGQIDVNFQSHEDGYEITVEDDGHGLPEGVKLADVKSTGMKIIRSIVEYEFKGEIEFQENDGIKVKAILRT